MTDQMFLHDEWCERTMVELAMTPPNPVSPQLRDFGKGLGRKPGV